MKIFETKWMIILAIILVLFGNFSLWLSQSIYNANNFKNNVTKTIESEPVRNAISAEVIDRILSENPRLKQIVSSPAQSAISGMLASPVLNPIIDKVAGKLQEYIAGGQKEVLIDLTPINNLLTAISRATSGESQAPPIKNTDIVILPANAFPNLNTWLRPITTLGPVLGTLGVILIVVIIVITENKLQKLWEVGLFLLIGTLLNVLLIPFVGSLIPQYISNSNGATIATEAFNIFTKSYYSQLIILFVFSVITILIRFLWPKLAESMGRKDT